MVEFFHHFKNLVEEKEGTIIESRKNQQIEYHCAILPHGASIQNQDHLTGGLAILWEDQRLKLRSFAYREVSNSCIIKPEKNRSLDFFPHELEGFVIEVFSQIEALRIHIAKDWAQHFKEAKSGSHPLSIDILSQMVDEICPGSDTYEKICNYILEEDNRGLNPLGKLGKRVRRTQVLDRFDAANAVMSLAKHAQYPGLRWQLMELGGKILWEKNRFQSISTNPGSILKLLQKDRRSSYVRGK
ncbi:MAG: hypothetical protein AAF696_17860 [Bacteroidota bacterium]